jgi:hypothetical protein
MSNELSPKQIEILRARYNTQSKQYMKNLNNINKRQNLVSKKYNKKNNNNKNNKNKLPPPYTNENAHRYTQSQKKEQEQEQENKIYDEDFIKHFEAYLVNSAGNNNIEIEQIPHKMNKLQTNEEVVPQQAIKTGEFYKYIIENYDAKIKPYGTGNTDLIYNEVHNSLIAISEKFKLKPLTINDDFQKDMLKICIEDKKETGIVKKGATILEWMIIYYNNYNKGGRKNDNNIDNILGSGNGGQGLRNDNAMPTAENADYEIPTAPHPEISTEKFPEFPTAPSGMVVGPNTTKNKVAISEAVRAKGGGKKKKTKKNKNVKKTKKTKKTKGMKGKKKTKKRKTKY